LVSGSLSHPLWTCNAFLEKFNQSCFSNTNAAENFNQSVFWGGEKTRFFVLTKCCFTKSSDHYGTSTCIYIYMNGVHSRCYEPEGRPCGEAWRTEDFAECEPRASAVPRRLPPRALCQRRRRTTRLASASQGDQRAPPPDHTAVVPAQVCAHRLHGRQQPMDVGTANCVAQNSAELGVRPVRTLMTPPRHRLTVCVCARDGAARAGAEGMGPTWYSHTL
jgi:hypothetical protein